MIECAECGTEMDADDVDAVVSLLGTFEPICRVCLPDVQRETIVSTNVPGLTGESS